MDFTVEKVWETIGSPDFVLSIPGIVCGRWLQLQTKGHEQNCRSATKRPHELFYRFPSSLFADWYCRCRHTVNQFFSEPNCMVFSFTFAPWRWSASCLRYIYSSCRCIRAKTRKPALMNKEQVSRSQKTVITITPMQSKISALLFVSVPVVQRTFS